MERDGVVGGLGRTPVDFSDLCVSEGDKKAKSCTTLLLTLIKKKNIFKFVFIVTNKL
jgi:hypothetical protein